MTHEMPTNAPADKENEKSSLGNEVEGAATVNLSPQEKMMQMIRENGEVDPSKIDLLEKSTMDKIYEVTFFKSPSTDPVDEYEWKPTALYDVVFGDEGFDAPNYEWSNHHLVRGLNAFFLKPVIQYRTSCIIALAELVATASKKGGSLQFDSAEVEFSSRLIDYSLHWSSFFNRVTPREHDEVLALIKEILEVATPSHEPLDSYPCEYILDTLLPSTGIKRTTFSLSMKKELWEKACAVLEKEPNRSIVELYTHPDYATYMDPLYVFSDALTKIRKKQPGYRSRVDVYQSFSHAEKDYFDRWYLHEQKKRKKDWKEQHRDSSDFEKAWKERRTFGWEDVPIDKESLIAFLKYCRIETGDEFLHKIILEMVYDLTVHTHACSESQRTQYYHQISPYSVTRLNQIKREYYKAESAKKKQPISVKSMNIGWVRCRIILNHDLVSSFEELIADSCIIQEVMNPDNMLGDKNFDLVIHQFEKCVRVLIVNPDVFTPEIVSKLRDDDSVCFENYYTISILPPAQALNDVSYFIAGFLDPLLAVQRNTKQLCSALFANSRALPAPVPNEPKAIDCQ